MSARLKSWIVVSLLLGTAVYAIAEDITLTTYYPSPRGVYQELKTAGDMVVGDITNPPAARLHVVQEGTAPALRVDDVPGDTSPLLIDQDGNVGIGTTSPTQLLDVNGQVRIRGGDPDAGEVLTATDATGVASWELALIPSGFVGFFNLPACPVGWTELTAARGRYLVGAQPGATLGAAGVVGNALDLVGGGLMENREVGQHTHTIIDPGHQHDISIVANAWVAGGISLMEYITAPFTPRFGTVPYQNQAHMATTGISQTEAEGTVAGTNAPYLQLLTCQKN